MIKLLYTPVFFVFCLLSNVIYGQPADAVYANAQTNGGTIPRVAGIPTGNYAVVNPDNAKSTTGTAKPANAGTQLSASSTAGVANAWLQLAFSASVTANKTVYIKVASGALALLGGGLTVQAYSTASGTDNPVSLANATPLSTYTADGNMYLAIKPTAAFRSVRISLTSPVLLGENKMNVFFAFYGPNQTNDTNPFPFNVADCGLPNVTSTEYSGLTVLGALTVANPGNAIDTDLNSVSAFNTSGASVAGHIMQTFYFNGTSNMADAVRIVFSKGTALVNVNVAKAITIQGYNGTTSVGVAKPLNVLIDLELLGLITSGATVVSAYFAPKDENNMPVIFDRVKVDFDLGLLGIALNGNGLNIYDVRRVPDVPVVPDVTACTNVGKINLAASTPQESIASIGNFIYTWYNAIRGGSILSSLLGKNPQVTGLTSVGQSSYYVDITKQGCTTPSERKKVAVTVVNPPVPPTVALMP